MSNLGTVAGIIAAIATSITALGGLVVSIKVLIPMLRTGRDTHKIVNQQRTDMQNWNRALVRTLRAHDIDIPVDQSKPNGETNGV